MAYLFRQKFNVADLARIPEQKNRVLIFGFDVYLCQLYESLLCLHSLDVKHCATEESLRLALADFFPRLLLLDLDSLGSAGESWLKSLYFRWDFPSLIIVTISRNLDAQSVGKLMGAGVSSHINREYSRPQDVATVVKTLLQ